ncbi:MAG: hypothetical protein ACI4XM_09005 [Candidatus Coprovivens sp.]
MKNIKNELSFAEITLLVHCLSKYIDKLGDDISEAEEKDELSQDEFRRLSRKIDEVLMLEDKVERIWRSYIHVKEE